MSALEIILSAALALLLLIVVALALRLRVLTRRVLVLEDRSPVGEGDLADLRHEIRQALRHVAVVRYDAFGDMGGRLSFSAAVIDDAGDGLVMSSIHGRGESRTYAKGIVGGHADATLSPEERQALAVARTGSADA